ISYPQVVEVLSVESCPTIQPQSFLLTARHLGVGCGQKWNEVVKTVQYRSCAMLIRGGGPVQFKADTPKTSPYEPKTTEIVAISTSPVAVAVAARKLAPVRGGTHVSRQSPNSRRRKRTAQAAGRIQAGDRREIWAPILHYEFGWENCPSLSL